MEIKLFFSIIGLIVMLGTAHQQQVLSAYSLGQNPAIRFTLVARFTADFIYDCTLLAEPS